VEEFAGDPIAIAVHDSQAFEQLMADQLDASLRLAVAILGDPEEARDATQEAFIAAWRQMPRLRDPAKAASWLHRITVNAAISRVRKRARDRTARESLGRQPAPTQGAPEDEAVVRRESLRAALWQLNPEHRAVLFLRYYEDLTVEQIAHRIGVREGTVKSRLHYGLERLRHAYEGPGEHV
jgi:RNA polymerase sigma-70 factor (ECF subfamily)